mmetsp:Transcript_94316/g.219153  ORF Transcript_94316/g.219153 Transcript_94316/m.219153 type:complete len:96 (+) Transcript_94316:102-389(+)
MAPSIPWSAQHSSLHVIACFVPDPLACGLPGMPRPRLLQMRAHSQANAWALAPALALPSFGQAFDAKCKAMEEEFVDCELVCSPTSHRMTTDDEV